MNDVCVSGTTIWVAAERGLFQIGGDGVHQRGSEPVTRVAPAPGGAAYARIRDLPYLVPENPDAERSTVESAPSLWELRSLPPPPEGAPSEIVAVFQGARYAATPRGLMVRSATAGFEPVPTGEARRIHALVRDRDGGLWCATESGLFHRRRDGSSESVAVVGGETLGVVTALGVDSEGALWIGSGSSFRGVRRLRNGVWEKMTGLDGYVHRMSPDPAGVMWFATLEDDPAAGRGAWYFRDGRFFAGTGTTRLPSMRIYDVVARDPRGVLWFGTAKGLAAYGGGDRARLYPDLPGGRVFCLRATRDGALWVGYQRGHGVSRLAGGRWTHFTKADGLCDDRVWSITEGKSGVLWFATEDGVSRFDGVNWSCLRGPDAPFWPLLVEDRVLWAGTLGSGLFRLDTSDSGAPRVSIAESEARGGRVFVRWTAEDARFATAPSELRYRMRVNGEPLVGGDRDARARRRTSAKARTAFRSRPSIPSATRRRSRRAPSPSRQRTRIRASCGPDSACCWSRS